MKGSDKSKQGNAIQYGIFIGLSLIVWVFYGILHVYGQDTYFVPYFGNISPLAAAGLITVLGVALLWVQVSHDWFVVYRKNNYKGLMISAALAVLFGLVIILLDLGSPFPADINVPFPQSLLFYPAIGFIVEILFHLLPLTILIYIILSVSKRLSINRIIWPMIILTALLEPVYQIILAFGESGSVWADRYVWIHIFLINVTQLWLFKRYDFVSMYLFRVVYYLIWHVLWGYLRLEVMFWFQSF
jgi:hypothetical protein